MLKIKVAEEEVDLAYLGEADDVFPELGIAAFVLIKELSHGDPELAVSYLLSYIEMLEESASAILDDTLRRVES